MSGSICLGGQFRCNDGPCIFARYACDGFPDCRDGSDEAVEICGRDPCKDRIFCEISRRCIPPYWCCHRRSKSIDDIYDCDFLQRKECCSRIFSSSGDIVERFRENCRNGECSFGILGQGSTDPLNNGQDESSPDELSLKVSGTFAAIIVLIASILLIVLIVVCWRWLARRDAISRCRRNNTRHRGCTVDVNRAGPIRPRNEHTRGIVPLSCNGNRRTDEAVVVCLRDYPGGWDEHGCRRTQYNGRISGTELSSIPEEDDSLPPDRAESPPPPYSDLEMPNGIPIRGTETDDLPSYDAAIAIRSQGNSGNANA